MSKTMIILGVILFSFNGLPSLSSEKTNIIVILADDMGFDSVSSNNSKIGNMPPCIDRLMEQRMRFSMRIPAFPLRPAHGTLGLEMQIQKGCSVGIGRPAHREGTLDDSGTSQERGLCNRDDR